MASLFTSASIADSNEARVSEIVNSTKGERERERSMAHLYILLKGIDQFVEL